jgi:hypothetical protein
MKKFIVLFGILVAGVLALCTSCGSIMAIQGNGNLVTSEKTFSSFEKVSISSSADVNYHIGESEEFRALITVDSNLEEYTDVHVDGNVLRIDTENGNYDFTKFHVEVYAPSLNSISVSGSGSFSTDEVMLASSFDTNVSGSGSINGTIECDNFSSKISGSGSVNIDGKSNNSDIEVSGSGELAGSDFIAKNVDINISGSGSVSIQATENIQGKISGSGDLNSYGDPTIDIDVSGSGDINKM